MPRDLTVAEVTEDLQLSTETVYRWLRSGKLAGYRLGGTKAGWRIPAAAVDRVKGAARDEYERAQRGADNNL